MGFWDFTKRALDPGGFVWDPNAPDKEQARKDAEPFRPVDPTGQVQREADSASRFADRSKTDFQRTGTRMDDLGELLRRRAGGQDSLSAEQLRQSLGQTQAAQQSMAASARPANAAMAARTAAMQMGRQQAGLAGQQALAGIQERSAAEQGLGQLYTNQRAQDLAAANAQRGLALQGLGDIEQNRSIRFTGTMPGVQATTSAAAEAEAQRRKGLIEAGAALFSDRRLKKSIKDGGDDADEFIRGLKAFSYRYKDDRLGRGKQLGVMAQAVEKTRFGEQIVRDTPEGKMLDVGKLSGANTAAIARLGERLAKLEGK